MINGNNKDLAIKIGAMYKHYKGGLYKVVGLARHSETLEDMVVYTAFYSGDYPDNQIWVRPLSMWFDHIVKPGIDQTRFVETDIYS